MGLSGLGYTVFLYDRRISSFSPGVCRFVPSIYGYLAVGGLSFGGPRLSTCSVILRYQADGLSGGRQWRYSVYARRILIVDRRRPILCAFDVETAVLDINVTSPPKCILGYKWDYWYLLAPRFYMTGTLMLPTWC